MIRLVGSQKCRDDFFWRCWIRSFHLYYSVLSSAHGLPCDGVELLSFLVVGPLAWLHLAAEEGLRVPSRSRVRLLLSLCPNELEVRILVLAVPYIDPKGEEIAALCLVLLEALF